MLSDNNKNIHVKIKKRYKLWVLGPGFCARATGREGELVGRMTYLESLWTFKTSIHLSGIDFLQRLAF